MSGLPWLSAYDLFIMGLSKIFLVETIHRISITRASAMAAFTPVFTLLFAFLLLGEVPPGRKQMSGILPVLIGGFLITSKRQGAGV